MILQSFGEVLEQKANYKLLYKFSDQSYTFSYGIENTGRRAIEMSLDCNSSKNMVYSEANGKITKTIEAGAVEFMMHAEASPGAEEFARGAGCTFKEI